MTLEEVQAFVANPENASEAYEVIREDLAARGFGTFVELDLSIVRGLAYYTGVVFEVFDSSKSMRAVAGGGRYDTLVGTISNGVVDMPATGFAMGDYVIRNLIEETTHAAMQMEVWLQRNAAGCEAYMVIPDEAWRGDALGSGHGSTSCRNFRGSTALARQGSEAISGSGKKLGEIRCDHRRRISLGENQDPGESL